jgi:hypothetical protein
MDESWDVPGYNTKELHPIQYEEEEEEEELPQKVKYANFQEEDDFDPEP